jgi:DNA-binding transcriptional ArsR family regulator
MQTPPADVLSSTFAALSDPTRRAILARLAGGEATVTELADPFDISLPAISKHLRVLQRAGLVEQGRQAQWRPCRLRPEPLAEAADWLERYRRLWEERFERLDEVLRELTGGTPAEVAVPPVPPGPADPPPGPITHE